MTLHHAIQELIRKSNRPMTATEIALELNRTDLYSKKDGTDIKSSQIIGRVENYPKLFSKEGELIGLPDGPLKAVVSDTPNVLQASPSENRHTIKIANPALAIKVLLNLKNYRKAPVINKIVPDQPGMFAIRIQRIHSLPKTFANLLEEKKHNLLYVGVAKQSLKRELLGEEVRAKGESRFFNTLGAVLGYLPPKGSLEDKSKPENFAFSESDQKELIDWMNQNLRVNWLCMDDGFDQLETQLILDEQPLLNVDNNPAALPEVKSAIKKCLKHAGAK